MIVKLLAALLLVVSLGAGYLFQQYKILIANQAKLETALETQTQALEQMEQSYQKQIEANTELQEQVQRASEGINRLRKTLSKHDLTKKAKEDATDLERRMNNATQKLFEEIRTFSDPSSDSDKLQ